VHAIDNAWTTLKARLTGAVDEISQLEQLAATLGESNSVELAAARGKLKQVLGQVDSDPLGVTKGFEQEIEPLIAPARQHLNGLAAQKTAVESGITAAGPLLAEVRQAHDQGKKAYAERAEKVSVADADNLPAPFEDGAIDQLATWLTRLETELATGGWRKVRVGLENWNIRANARLTHARSVVTGNSKPLEKRRELRLLLDGLKAKARARGLAEDPEATAIYNKAHGLLYTRPTPLAEAEKLVFDYQKAIR
jgi:hypothetical protein